MLEVSGLPAVCWDREDVGPSIESDVEGIKVILGLEWSAVLELFVSDIVVEMGMPPRRELNEEEGCTLTVSVLKDASFEDICE